MAYTPSERAASERGRYEELSVLGHGGAGTVHLVRDRETGDRLALKRLMGAAESNLQRLKREFRSLADFHHPNLIKLYELGQDEISAYFTMEYLEGQDLQAYLSARQAANDNEQDHVATVVSAFEQLATAVRALHAAGILHRDLKPTNVMVSGGRVVVLDFGIALEVGSSAVTLSQDQLYSGTPAYMAPEQIRGEHLGEPNDWYAFGVMLYEALSGILPIDGTLAELLVRKFDRVPAPIDQLVPALPKTLSDLCMRLLQRAPEERPQGDQILSVLRAQIAKSPDPAVVRSLTSRFTTETELSLIGREPELDTLWAAFRETQSGNSAAVHVVGESGAGKSLLLNHFSNEVVTSFRAGDTPPLVLRSRCYERENLTFKALDGAMDALVDHLSREPNIVVSHVLPKDLIALTQLFPTFKSLPATRHLLTGAKLPVGMSQARVQAEASLRELLQRLAKLAPVVLWIDDLQWGDLDSIGILSSWLKPPYIPNLMLVFSYRSEEVSTSPGIRALRQNSAEGSSIEKLIPLRALRDDDVRALCKQRFEHAKFKGEARAQVIERIVLEARGSPFLASQLLELAIALPSTGEQQLARLSLEELVRSRSQVLSNSARQVLNVLSVAGRPIPLALAVRAAGVTDDVRACIHELQSSHLIRTRDSASDRLLEVYHDRLREVVQSLLTLEERRALDWQLMEALRETGSADCDWLHALALALDDRADALRYGLLAAARAGEMLAFERAAELYERCLKLAPDPSANNGELWHKLALAYSYAGHGFKAATIYLHAAQHVSAEQALLFERAAASQLLCSGRFEEGEALLVRVLERLNLSAPTSFAGLVAALVWERARASVRGFSYTPRNVHEVPFLEHFSAELCGMLSMETAVYDPLRAAVFQARNLRMALDLGVHEGVGRALCVAATIISVDGSQRSKARAESLLAKAEAILGRSDNSLLRANIITARAMCAFLTGQTALSVELCAQAEHVLRTATEDSEYHYRFTLASVRITALFQLAEFRRAEAELQTYVKEAVATENINAELHGCLIRAWGDAIMGRAESAASRLDREREQLPRMSFGALHVLYMISVLHVGCATQRYAWALEATREQWPAFLRSVVTRSETLSILAYEVHARALINCAVRGEPTGELASELRVHRAALKKAQYSVAGAMLSRIEARLCLVAGDKPAALQRLAESSRVFESSGWLDHAARDRYALGILTGGDTGAELTRAALERLGELGIVAPMRELRAYYPELCG